MTNEQINIAIGKHCGWKNIAFNRGWIKSGDGETQCVIPNYCNDLNAMHEAEKVLSATQRIIYADQLCIIWTGRDDRAIPIWFWINEATARQRAEAFLRTIGKWEGEK
jgi:hypothetical protein